MRNKPYPYYKLPVVNDMRDLVLFCKNEYGDKTAFRFLQKKQEVTVSYIQFADDIKAFGTFLIYNGFSGKHIALLGENSYAWVVAYFSVISIGGVIVPIDKELNIEYIAKLVKKSDCEAVLHSAAYEEEAEYTGVNCISLKQISAYIEEGKRLISDGNGCFDEIKVSKHALCSIVFTSGTTSEPKGVMLSHNNLIQDAINSQRNLDTPDGCVAILPMNHLFCLMADVICQMLKGQWIFISGSLKRVMSDIAYAAPRHISAVPMLIASMYNGIWNTARNEKKEKQLKMLIGISNALLLAKIDLRKKLFRGVLEGFGGKLEMIISGGSSIDEKYIKGFRGFGITVVNGYGITECSPIVATVRNKHYAPKSVGSVDPGLDFRIVDGEIQLKGETLFLGYYKDEQATKEAFDGEWFKTGDLGYLDKDGLLYITGRKKNLIILSNGKNVSPEELEAKITEKIPGIKEILVYAENDKITAEIYSDELDGNKKETVNGQILSLNRELPQYKQIAKVKFRDTEFPKTSTKKIKRN